MDKNILFGIWVVSAIYCVYKLFKRSKNISLDGVIGYSPGLEVVMVIILGPLLAMIDISLTWIRIYKEVFMKRIFKMIKLSFNSLVELKV